MSTPRAVASLWIGGDLSWLEQLCIRSFLHFGHSFTLYTYEGVGNAPPGTVIADANDVFPASAYLTHRVSGSPAVHADAFRYRMIAQTGLTWVDADILCVRPWPAEPPYLFGWEKPGRVVCNAVLGLPAGSRTLALLNEFCRTEYPVPPWAAPEERARLERAHAEGRPVHVSDLDWGVWGPGAVTHFLQETGEIAQAMPQQAFYPIAFKDRRDLLNPAIDVAASLGEGCFGVHLWNRRLRRRLITHHNGVPPPQSFLGRAVRLHGIDCAAAPIPDVPPAHIVADRTAAIEAASALTAEGDEAAAAEPLPARLLRDLADPAADRVQTEPPRALTDLAVREARHSHPHFGPIAAGLERRLFRVGPWLAPPAQPPRDERILVVTAMKNEGPFIVEWIAYNLAIGVDHFLVYTNDCTDNTDIILDRLAEMGHVTRLQNPYQPGGKIKPQHAALKDATSQPAYKAADWIVTIDLDEFIAIHVGDGTLRDLFRAANHPNAISLTWRFFGNGGVIGYEDRPIIEQFTRCAPEFLPDPGLAWGFKTMFNRRTCRFRKLGVHRPAKMAPGHEGAVRWVNGSGRVMPRRLIETGWRTVQPIFGYRLATLNHYALRSAESYLVKRDRGRINHTDQDQGVYYWQRRNYITEADDRILAVAPRMHAELSRLMSDAKLSGLHAQAVDWHRERIARLRANPDYARVFDDLVRTSREDATFFVKPGPEEEAQRIGPPPPAVPPG